MLSSNSSARPGQPDAVRDVRPRERPPPPRVGELSTWQPFPANPSRLGDNPGHETDQAEETDDHRANHQDEERAGHSDALLFTSRAYRQTAESIQHDPHARNKQPRLPSLHADASLRCAAQRLGLGRPPVSSLGRACPLRHRQANPLRDIRPREGLPPLRVGELGVAGGHDRAAVPQRYVTTADICEVHKPAGY